MPWPGKPSKYMNWIVYNDVQTIMKKTLPREYKFLLKEEKFKKWIKKVASKVANNYFPEY